MSMSAEPSSLDVFTESENDLSKFPEAEFVESHEIQALVDPKVVITPMEGDSSSIREQKLQHVKRLLRKMISAKTAELKARWSDHENMQIVVYQPPKYPMNMTPSLQVAQVQDKPTKSPTTVIGEEVVSFELPTEFSEDLKTLIPEGSPHRFSFSERLDGWRITQRRRTKGGKDTFYRHEKSNSWLMRSIVEAVRFIMYEKFPKQGGASSDDEERRTSSAPRQRKDSDVDCYNNKISEENMQGFDGEPYTEERVTEFFKSAYENLTNLKFIDKMETERKPVKVPQQNPSPPSIFSCSSSREGHANSPSGPSMFGGVEARATATAERLQDFTVDMSYPRLEDIRITPMRPLS